MLVHLILLNVHSKFLGVVLFLSSFFFPSSSSFPPSRSFPLLPSLLLHLSCSLILLMFFLPLSILLLRLLLPQITYPRICLVNGVALQGQLSCNFDSSNITNTTCHPNNTFLQDAFNDTLYSMRDGWASGSIPMCIDGIPGITVPQTFSGEGNLSFVGGCNSLNAS